MATGPGVFWINSGVADKTVLAYDDYVRWYETVHIPDVMNASAEPLPVARRYERVGGGGLPFLAVYTMPDLAFASSAAFQQVPMTHETLPAGMPVWQLANFCGRHAKYVRTESAGSSSEEGRLLVSEVTRQPDVAVARFQGQDGWLRSTQFRVALGFTIEGGVPTPPTMDDQLSLVLHEFSDMPEAALEGLVTKGSEIGEGRVEQGVFRLLRTMGDATVAFTV